MVRAWPLVLGAALVCLAGAASPVEIARAEDQAVGENGMEKQAPAPWPSTREEFRASLQESGLDDALVDHLTAQVLPAVRLVTSPADPQTSPLGASRLGGAPDLPAEISWPVRPPYADAEVRAAAYRKRAADALADAGLVPDWMPADEGERYVAERQKFMREIHESTAALTAQYEGSLTADELAELTRPTPENARESSREDLQRAQAVAKPFPLSFVAQLDLEALSVNSGFDPALPKEGRLLLFYDLLETPAGWDPNAAIGFRVVWDRSRRAALRRSAVPSELSAIESYQPTVLNPATLGDHAVITAIPPSDKNWDAFPIGEATSRPEDDEAYWAYDSWLSRFGTPDTPDGWGHQLGGWPQPIQNGMQARAQLAANGINAGTPEAYETPAALRLLADAKAWKLILQLGVDEAVGLRAGAYYVLLRSDDLAARRFDKVWVVFDAD